MKRITLSAIAATVSLCAYGSDPIPGGLDSPAPESTVRWYSAEQVTAGRRLYGEHCASCHGASAEGTATWRKRDASGNYPPPPLNGTAHTWHHSLAVLDATIVNGGAAMDGVMPGFGNLLDRDQRLAVIAYFQDFWSDEIYRRWKEIDGR